MPEQTPLDSNAAIADAGQQNDQSEEVDATQLLAIDAEANPVSQSAAAQSPASASNQTLYYGALAAVVGIVAGLTIAIFAGGAASSSAPSASASASSNTAAAAENVNPQTAAPLPAGAPTDTPAAQAASDPQPVPASHRRAKKKDLAGPTRFAIEGDDELVGFDPSKGVLQTSARKTFLVSTAALGSNSSAWQDWPANIHYKCDLNSSCTLTRSGAAALHARLKN